MTYCKRQQPELPPLTAIIVSKGKGIPGHGLTTTTPHRLDRDREKVFTYKWYERLPPTVADFEKIKRNKTTERGHTG
jgi:hypothetical protein